ncbi:S-adenosyl-l-methionine hydroxide adenosyltransferase family protein [Candidatus Hepatincolaceae symbiont of Richtersius coronifer]
MKLFPMLIAIILVTNNPTIKYNYLQAAEKYQTSQLKAEPPISTNAAEIKSVTPSSTPSSKATKATASSNSKSKQTTMAPKKAAPKTSGPSTKNAGTKGNTNKSGSSGAIRNLPVSTIIKTSNLSVNAVIIMSDLGLQDGALARLKGSIYSINSNIPTFEITQYIPAYNIWEGAYRLQEVSNFWPKGTVFLSIVNTDPNNIDQAIIAKSKTSQYFVNPNNGLLTLIKENIGLEEVRIISREKLMSKIDKGKLPAELNMYALTAALLANQQISFADIGNKFTDEIITLQYIKPTVEENNLIGMVSIIEPTYGNVWTNIPKKLFSTLKTKLNDKLNVKIYYENTLVYNDDIPYVGGVAAGPESGAVLYLNNLSEVSLALNMGDFANTYQIESGASWKIVISKLNLS